MSNMSIWKPKNDFWKDLEILQDSSAVTRHKKVFMVTLELSSIAKMGIGWMNVPEPKNDF